MVEWFAKLIKEKIWKALVDSVKDLLNKAESEVEDYLRDKDKIEKGKNLSTNPLVKVLDVNEDEDTLTLLMRGRIKLFKDAITSAFMRIEVVISRDVDFSLSSFPIVIKEWRTIIGDISFGKKNVFDAALTLGYDNGFWLGRGKVKILPAGFGLDVFSSEGINDRGGVFEIDTDFSAPIPLGSTGVYLGGICGAFAFNFIPRLEIEGVAVTKPTAEHYTAWAFNHEADRWKFGPIEETTSGIAIGADLADKTRSMRLEPAGLAVLTPGPVFIIGGTGILLKSASTKLEGYIVVDVASDSLALGLAANIKIPASGSNKLVEANGVVDAFFPFKGSSLWHINFGTEKKPIKAKILKDVLRCDLYLMISQSKIQFGAGISIGGEWKWKIITFIARIGARVGATIGWIPRELQGEFEINGELGIKIWKIKFILRGFARVIGYIPNPNKLEFELEYKLKLPFPAPPINGKKTISYSDEEPVGPPLTSPLLVGTATTKGTKTKVPLKCAGIHALTGLQWELGETAAWGDLEIVVQFHRRARDTTGTIIGPAISPENNGGWNVDHVITRIKLKDKVNNTEVPGVQGVWAAGPDGDTPRLHLLGQDPLSWLIPQPHAFAQVQETPAAVVYQKFGYGPDECFTDSKRFGNMKVKPNLQAHLVSAEPVGLPGRVMACSNFKLIFSDVSKQLIDIDRLYLVVLSPYREKPAISFDSAQSYSVSLLQPQLDGNFSLNEISISITSPITSITINSNNSQPLLVFAVRYREARRTSVTVQTRVILHPGSYNLLIEGYSTAKHIEGNLPDSHQVNWTLDQDFAITYPELLRPYIHYASTGDIRLFADRQEQWDPTMPGVGFPHYRHYHPVVRFKVGYMHSMFSQLKMKFIFDDKTEEVQNVPVQNNTFGETYLPDKAINWITVNGGSVPADSEIIFSQPLPKFGPAQLEIFFDTPDGEEIKLDSWTCYLSGFTSFAQHLSWSQASLKTYYNSQGKQSQAGCAALPVQGHQPKFRYTPGNRMDSENTHSAKSGEMATTGVSEQPSVIKLENVVSAGTSFELQKAYPVEYKKPPVSWRLSHSLVQHIGALDETSGTRFGRFAHATGVRFNDDASLTPLNGINDTVITTTIEGIADTKGRLYALWLRTPEPVDWRRVSAEMTIHHIEPAEGCPDSFAHREALSLDIDILPSADGSSAFLIGLIDRIHTKLPRGVYLLKLTFNAHQQGLLKLRLSTSIGSTLEVVTYRFIQPIGEPWPLPEDTVTLPGHFVEDLIELSEIDPRDIIRLWGGPAPAELINEIKTKISGQRIEQARSQDTPFLYPHFTNMANTLNYVKGQVDFISRKMPVETFKSQTYVSGDSEVEPGKTPGKISDVDVKAVDTHVLKEPKKPREGTRDTKKNLPKKKKKKGEKK